MFRERNNIFWNIIGAIIVLPLNILAFPDSQFSQLSRAKSVSNLLQLNSIPHIHKHSAENLTIFELVTVSQLQDFVGSLIGSKQFHDPFWISTPFLTSLLDSSQWSLIKAKRKIQKAIYWRNNNEDIVNQQPNQNLFDYFDLDIKGFDKSGCPVVIMPIGKWRTYRSYLEKIKSIPEAHNNLKIYFSNIMEKILYQIRTKKDSQCSQFTLIADMEQYSTVHVSGLKFFIDIIRLFDKVYPGFVKIAYIINSTPTFLKYAQTYKSQIPWDLRRKSFIYTDKSFWKEAILQNIDASQLAPSYGGTNFFLER